MLDQNSVEPAAEKLDTDIDIEECPKCHSPLHEHSGHSLPPSSIVEDSPDKSPRKATIIAIIGGLFGIQGLGHIYVGKLGKGFGILDVRVLDFWSFHLL